MMLYQCDKCGKTTPQNEDGEPIGDFWIEISERVILFNSIFTYHFCHACADELFKASNVKRKSHKDLP